MDLKIRGQTSGSVPNVCFYSRSILILLALNEWTFASSIYLQIHKNVASLFAVSTTTAEHVPAKFGKRMVTSSIDKTECTKCLSKNT